MITYKCGCQNEAHAPTGALRSVAKCAHHRAMQGDPRKLDEAYYRENGSLDEDAPERYVGQLVEALGELPEAFGHRRALEIGCGVSPYYNAIRAAGWSYSGIDPSWYAVEFMLCQKRAGLWCGNFEERSHEIRCQRGLILAAHCFEHMVDAPAAIVKAAGLLAPGGQLWLIVPDDEDPLNPDHLWFFSEPSLRKAVEMAGLKVEGFAKRRYIERESFLYLRASKP